MRVPCKKASANSVPAAAVIRGMQALSGFIGFKGCVGGEISQRDTDAVGGMCGVAVKCIDITQNTDCEGISRSRNRR